MNVNGEETRMRQPLGSPGLETYRAAFKDINTETGQVVGHQS